MVKKSIDRLTKSDWILIVGASVLYLLLLYRYIVAVDDVMYSFQRIGGHIRWNMPVNSLFDAIKSQCEDYIFRNGRFVTHTIVQYLCGVSYGRWIFFLCSTLMFSLLLSGLIKTIRYINKGVCQSLVVLVLLFILIPIPGQTYIGNIAFTVNYLWTSAASVWILYFFIKYKDLNYSIKYFSLLAIFFLFAGCLHEGFSLPISGLFFIALCFDRGYRKSPFRYLVIIYWIGTLSSVLAPSNFRRVDDMTNLVGYGQGFVSKAITVIIALLRQEVLVTVFMLCIIFLIVAYWKKLYKVEYIRSLLPYVVVGIGVLLFAVIIAYVGKHQLVPLGLMSTVIISCMISRLNIFGNRYVCYSTNILLTGVVLYICVRAYNVRTQLQTAWYDMHKEASAASCEYAYADELLKIPDQEPDYILRMTSIRDVFLHVQNKHWFELLTSVIATDGKNPEKIKAVLPDYKENIIKACRAENRINDGVYSKDRYLIAKVPKDCEDVLQLNIIYKPGRLGKIRELLGRRASTFVYPAPTGAHEFTDGSYRYVIFFVDAASIQSCRLADAQPSHK